MCKKDGLIWVGMVAYERVVVLKPRKSVVKFLVELVWWTGFHL